LFGTMLDRVRETAISTLMHLEMQPNTALASFEQMLKDAGVNLDELSMKGVNLEDLLSREFTDEIPEMLPGTIDPLAHEESKVPESNKRAAKKTKAKQTTEVIETEKPVKKTRSRKSVDPLEVKVATPSAMEASSKGRNALCHCGSGLRYKHCHGKL
jgi:hypothetical protein